MALSGLRSDNLRSQCGWWWGQPISEEGRGFFELGSWCAEADRTAGIWGLEGKKQKVSPQKAAQQLWQRRERVELRGSLLIQLWLLSVLVWGAGIQEALICSVQTSELMLTDAHSYSQNLSWSPCYEYLLIKPSSKAELCFQGETPSVDWIFLSGSQG